MKEVIKKLLRENLLRESIVNTPIYRGGFLNSRIPSFWSTDINVAMAFFNESRFIADLGSEKKILSWSDVEYIKSSIEPSEDIEWILGWDIISSLESIDNGLSNELDNIFNKIPNKLIISENPEAGLLTGFPQYNNPMILDFKGKVWGEHDAIIENFFNDAKSKNNDVIIVNNIIEGGLGIPIGDNVGTTYVDITGGKVINIDEVSSDDYPNIEGLY